jgi:hypothetical protein
MNRVLHDKDIREPMENPHVTWKRKLSILWRPELAQLQAWNQMPKYRETIADYKKK